MTTFSDPPLVCRPALPSDTSDVFEFTGRIWEGRDYIHLVWEEWLADPHGILVSAQLGPRVVGIAKVSPVFPGQWWLHGLRVDPEHQGMKIGSRLHEFTNSWWLTHGDGTIRLLTGTNRVQVHHLCERTGYTRLAEIITYRRLLTPGGRPTNAAPAPLDFFQPVTSTEVPAALEFARQHHRHIGGLMDIGWRFVEPDQASLTDCVRAARLHWWRGREGLLATWEDDEDSGPVLGIGLAATREPGQLEHLLRDVELLADPMNVQTIFWLAPREPLVETALEHAGYSTDQDSGVLYVRSHPGSQMDG